jgi:hypothetical protein
MTASDHAQQRPQRFPLPERGRPQMVSGHCVTRRASHRRSKPGQHFDPYSATKKLSYFQRPGFVPEFLKGLRPIRTRTKD